MLIDKIKSKKYKVAHFAIDSDVSDAALGELADEFDRMRDQAVCFNFADVFPLYSEEKNNKGSWRFSQNAFASIPPYPLTWCEFSDGSASFAALFDCLEVEESGAPSVIQAHKRYLADYVFEEVLYQETDDPNIVIIEPSYLTVVTLLIHAGGDVLWTVFPTFYYFSGADGRPISVNIPMSEAFSECLRRYRDAPAGTFPDEEAPLHLYSKYSSRVLFFQYAFNLMACKNVETITVRPDKKLRQARHRRGKPPLSEYKTLRITVPGKGFHQERNDSAIEAMRNRLHTVRGHFADYRAGKGLFGRIKGRFWIPAHTRGDAELGEVRKDYSVKASGSN